MTAEATVLGQVELLVELGQAGRFRQDSLLCPSGVVTVHRETGIPLSN